MVSFVVFDLDGTLAKVGEPTGAEEVALLKEIEQEGAAIALSSGKPTFYLCGFARQMGLKEAYLIGENGGVLQKGVQLPPPLYRKADIPQVCSRALGQLREKMEKAFPDRIWYQHNETALTPFPAYPEDFPPLRRMLEEFITPEMQISTCEHPDCFDVQYARLSKGEGIRLLSEVSGADPETMIAVGDWVNDYSMFQAVGYSVGIHLPDPARASVNFPTLKEALLHILEKVRQRN